MFSGEDEYWNQDDLNVNFMESSMNKVRNCTKSDNSKNFTIDCFCFCRWLVSKTKIYSLRVYSEYEEICKILNA